MDIRLLVTPRNELVQWGTLFSDIVERSGGGQVLFCETVDQALVLLSNAREPVQEIITDPFGTSMGGQWRELFSYAKERNIPTTLVTPLGKLAQEAVLEKLSKEGVSFLDPYTFDVREYALDRCPAQRASSQERK